MIEWLIKTSDPVAYGGLEPVRCGTLGTDTILNVLALNDPTRPADTLIGAWDYNGLAAWTPNLDLYKQIRPLGNNPDGSATPTLDYHHWMGWAPRKIGTDGSLYPDDIKPFRIEIRHKEFVGEANPEWNGWGWRAEIVGSAASRDPSARAIAIYADPECTQYLYTTGAFSQGQSEWQTDEDGALLTVWFTQYNPAHLGYNNDERQSVNHAVLFGSVQEGHATLAPDVDGMILNYWEHEQGYEPPQATWVDTGVTVAQLVGAGVYRVSATVTLTPGQAIKLGSAETTFTGYWSGQQNYLLISPHVTAPVGAKVWKWA